MKAFYEDDFATLYHGDAYEIMPALNDCIGMIVTDSPVGTNYPDWEPGYNALLKTYHQLTDGAIVWLAASAPITEMCGTPFPAKISKAIQFARRTMKARSSMVRWNPPPCMIHIWAPNFRQTNHLRYVQYRWMPIYFWQIAKDGRRETIVIAGDCGERSQLHQAEKPLGLITQLCRVGDGLVLDPFCGSGTTLVAAKSLQRRAVGIEISKEACEIAANRLRAME